MRYPTRLITVAAVTGALLLGACAENGSNGPDVAGDASGPVYFIFPDLDTVRFENFDKPRFEAAMEERAPGTEVITLNSEGSVQTQLNQVQTAVTRGASAIVLVAVDPDQAAGALAVAAESAIPVICNSHACNGGPAYAYQIADFIDIGETHGQLIAEEAQEWFDETGSPLRLAKMYGDPKYPFYVDQVAGFDAALNPLIEEGVIDVVCQADALDWTPANSQDAMDQCLTQTNNEVDAILTMNDDLGGGALAAATAAGLTDIKLYGGYDASLAGVQRVAAGQQAMDMAIDYTTFNESIADLVVSAMNGEEVPGGSYEETYDNGHSEVPQIEVENMVIRADTIQEMVVDTGLYTKEEICTNSIASDSEYCRS